MGMIAVMPKVRANRIQIEYDTFGDPSAEPLLMIMGLGAQMILWHEDFCAQLADRGHYAIRFDNRDVGLSTKFAQRGLSSITELYKALLEGRPFEAPYTLDDMADDAVGLLDALGIDRAHVCGASMGGMIAQVIAIRCPSRVKSLISMMSTTGEPGLPRAQADAGEYLFTPVPAQREAFIEFNVMLWRTIGSPGFPFDEEEIRKTSARLFDRSFYPQGEVRQLAAVAAHGSRREALSKLDLPTLVIHGAEDPLVPVDCGEDTAAAIPGAELLIIEGMGHDNPRPAWPQIIDAITSLTQRASA